MKLNELKLGAQFEILVKNLLSYVLFFTKPHEILSNPIGIIGCDLGNI